MSELKIFGQLNIPDDMYFVRKQNFSNVLNCCFEKQSVVANNLKRVYLACQKIRHAVIMTYELLNKNSVTRYVISDDG